MIENRLAYMIHFQPVSSIRKITGISILNDEN
jgi:hypothetical protein